MYNLPLWLIIALDEVPLRTISEIGNQFTPLVDLNIFKFPP